MLDEYNAAIHARHVKWKIKYELTAEPPETYRIEPYAVGGAHITGGDLRGLMYGLLEAADQIRATGRMKQAHAEPATPVRGVRRFASGRGYGSAGGISARVLSDPGARPVQSIYADFTSAPANPEKLRAISQLAADYAVDFTLGLWGSLSGSLAKLVSACPLIRTVEVLAAADQPIHLTLQLSFLKEIRTVRLHYRPADSAALTGVIEKPAAASLSFEIPGASSDLIYYFEILNRENSGWFEPDPEVAKPYYMIRVEQK